MIYITGANGFLGSNLALSLSKLNVPFVKSNVNLLNLNHTLQDIDSADPQTIIHCAALCGGIQENISRPAEFINNNLVIGLNILSAAKDLNIPHVINISSACAYPFNLSNPSEKELWNGPPHPTHSHYGIAKRSIISAGQAYMAQYKLNVSSLILANLYGPLCQFNPASSHVIPALIHKIHNAKINNLKEITLWGSGMPQREFLFVEDACNAIINLGLKYCDSEPLNVGSGEIWPIHAIASEIAILLQYDGLLKWDTKMDDGQLIRTIDSSKAKALGFVSNTSLKKGLERTVQWFNEKNERSKRKSSTC